MRYKVNENAIANELMSFYRKNLGRGILAVHSAETIGNLLGKDVGNALVRGVYGIRNHEEVENDILNSNVVLLADSQSGRMNNDEIKWSI